MSSDLRLLQMLGGTNSIKPQIGGSQKASSISGQPGNAEYQAFDIQMNMMRQLLDTGADAGMGAGMATGLTSGQDPFGLASAALDDPRMQDALSTISRLFNRQQLTRGSTQVNSLLDRGAAVSKDFAQISPPVNTTGQVKANNTVYQVVGGELSAVFESGSKGAGAIGYDRVGGTSYGTFQIASRTGSMDRFIKFLKTDAPDLARRLDRGHYNTGSKGGVVPNIWKRIAKEDPTRFEALQRDFIKQDHYSPARKKILSATGVDIDQSPAAVREVLWSTSVQHGPTGAARIFNRAIGVSKLQNGETNFERLVAKVYDSRKHQFNSSSSRVRRSVQNRLSKEQNIALAMLKQNSSVNQLV